MPGVPLSPLPWGRAKLPTSCSVSPSFPGQGKAAYVPISNFPLVLKGSELLGPIDGMLDAILNNLGLSCSILEAILGYLRPSWSHIGPSWTLQPLATSPVQTQGSE